MVLKLSVKFYPGGETCRVELPERALLITKWTHHDTASNVGITNFFAKRRIKKNGNKTTYNERFTFSEVKTKRYYLTMGSNWVSIQLEG